jgi:Right handed beta helix region
MRLASVLVLVPTLLGLAGLAAAEVNQKAIDDVKAGRVKEARASWWGFDAVEATQTLQGAIDSGAPKVIIDNVGQPWIVDQITLASNQELLFEQGVEVVAKRGAFKGTNDPLFRAVLKENITLSGYGATLRMWRSDYAGPEYTKGEWRHVLELKSCSNVQVLGLTLAESGGDGIYLGTGKAGVTNRDVLIKDVTCDRNYRQGISVITAENLLIENCILRETGGTPPQAGIDFEPNGPDEPLVNCVMRNCTTQANGGGGFVAYLNAMTAESKPISLRFENCKAIGDAQAATAFSTGNAPAKAVKGTVEYVNCTFEGSRAAGIWISDKPADGSQVRFEKCSVLDCAPEAPQQSPIVLTAGQGCSEPVGRITFVDCLVRDALGRKPMMLIDNAGVGLKAVAGALLIEKGGEKQRVELTDKVLADWMPAAALKPVPRFRMAGVRLEPVSPGATVAPDALAFVRQRQAVRLLTHVNQGQEVRLRIRYGQVGKYAGQAVSVVVTSPSGKEVVRTPIEFLAETDVAFTAPETGVYVIAVSPGSNFVQVVSSTHPLIVGGEDAPIRLYSTTGEVFFWVPAATKDFAVRLCGEGTGEAVKAALVDPSGKVVEEADNITQARQFDVALAQPSVGEAWSLRLARATNIMMEDYSVDLRGVPPLLAGAREALLKPTQ